MSWGLLHADPAPEAFRLDPATGRCGVIDWSHALCGPLLYDLASAVLYAGGPDRAETLVRAYLSDGTLQAAEVQHGLAPMLQFRWAVQANYFAWRITTNNLTGISGPQDNEQGLEDARRSLTFLSIGARDAVRTHSGQSVTWDASPPDVRSRPASRQICPPGWLPH
jgi:Ser/Thr protein kinase RdoA (MazF antagonist)